MEIPTIYTDKFISKLIDLGFIIQAEGDKCITPNKLEL
jgi:hypothetical protein